MLENKKIIIFMATFSLIATIINILHLVRDGIQTYVVILLIITAYYTGYYFDKWFCLNIK